MAEEPLGPSESHDLNISIRELIYTLRNPSVSRLGKFTSSASFLQDLPDKNKFKSIETLTKGWFKQATSLADNIHKLERNFSSAKGQGLAKASAALKKLVDDYNDLEQSAKALKQSNLKNYLSDSSTAHLKGIARLNYVSNKSLGSMGRRVEKYSAQSAQDAESRANATSAELQRKNEERSVERQRKESARRERDSKIRNAQDVEWDNREAYFGAKYPSGFSFFPTELRKQKAEHERLRQDFKKSSSVGERDAILGNLRENLNAQSQSGYNISRGKLVNIGGLSVGTSPREIAGAVTDWGLGKLAAAGPAGEVAAGVIKLGIAAARAANAVMGIPSAITSFTGSIVGQASPASSVYRQSQMMSLLGGGDRSDYRRWWSLTNQNSIYNHRAGTSFPMMIGPGEMSKLTGNMSLSGIGGLMSPQSRFAGQLNDAYGYSSRFGGSRGIISYLKRYATVAPGYNFDAKRAQIQGSYGSLYDIVRARHQDPDEFHRMMGSAVQTLGGFQTTSSGNIGAGTMSLAASMAQNGQQQYQVSSIMPHLVQGLQNLYGNRFSNPAYATGQMLFLQQHGGVRGLMGKGSPYASLLKNYGKLNPSLMKDAQQNPAMAMIFMHEALRGHGLAYQYAKSSIGTLGYTSSISDLMLGNVTGLGPTQGALISTALTKHPNLTKGQIEKITRDANAGIKPKSSMEAAIRGPITQEMQEFNSSLVSLNKSRVIVRLGQDMGYLDDMVNRFANTIFNKLLGVP